MPDSRTSSSSFNGISETPIPIDLYSYYGPKSDQDLNDTRPLRPSKRRRIPDLDSRSGIQVAQEIQEVQDEIKQVTRPDFENSNIPEKAKVYIRGLESLKLQDIALQSATPVQPADHIDTGAAKKKRSPPGCAIIRKVSLNVESADTTSIDETVPSTMPSPAEITRLSKYVKGRKNSTCFVKWLAGPDLQLARAQSSFMTLNEYSKGTLSEKLKVFKAGDRNVNVYCDGQCLLLASDARIDRPEVRDYVTVQVTCECDEVHMWKFQRGILMDFSLGLYGTFADDPDAFLKLTQLDSSHLCHNSICCDPFHFAAELKDTNNNICRCANEIRAGKWVKCSHEPACKLQLIGPMKTPGYWKARKKVCDDLVRKKVWSGSVCIDKSKSKWTTLFHWNRGLMEVPLYADGVPVAVYD